MFCPLGFFLQDLKGTPRGDSALRLVSVEPDCRTSSYGTRNFILQTVILDQLLFV